MKLQYTNPLDGKISTCAATITTDHPLSSYGQPVIILDDGNTIDAQNWSLFGFEVLSSSQEEIPLLNRWLISVSSNNKKVDGTIYGEKMRQVITLMPSYMIDWLETKPGTRAETIRAIIQKAIDDEQANA